MDKAALVIVRATLAPVECGEERTYCRRLMRCVPHRTNGLALFLLAGTMIQADEANGGAGQAVLNYSA